VFEPLLPPAKSTGRPRTVSLMLVMQAIPYVWVTGCAWHLLPKEYPPYSTVYYSFRQWRDEGTWKRIHDALFEQVRRAAGRNPSPSAASLDSQSIPTAAMVHEAVGFDSGKKIDGRKRFTLVDTLGLSVRVLVTAANVPEREGAKHLLYKVNQDRERFPRLARIWVDGGFSGQDFFRWVVNPFRWILETGLRPQDAQGFISLPKRWVVERTYGFALVVGCIGVVVSRSIMSI
jgi:transposase